jgi:hypothetical protein
LHLRHHLHFVMVVEEGFGAETRWAQPTEARSKNHLYFRLLIIIFIFDYMFHWLLWQDT